METSLSSAGCRCLLRSPVPVGADRVFVEFFKLFLFFGFLQNFSCSLDAVLLFVVEQASLAPNSFAPDGQLFTCPFPACCFHHPECKQPRVWGCAVCHLQIWGTH